MKGILAAFACMICATGAIASVGFDRDRDGYEDGEATSGYVTYSYVTTEPLAEGPAVVTRRVIVDNEPVLIISEDEARTRRVIRRAHQTAPNHR